MNGPVNTNILLYGKKNKNEGIMNRNKENLTIKEWLAGMGSSSPRPPATRVLNAEEIDKLLGFDLLREQEEELELRMNNPTVKEAWVKYEYVDQLYKDFMRALNSTDYVESQFPEIPQFKKIIERRKRNYDVILKLNRE
jgi:hypothetical protein